MSKKKKKPVAHGLKRKRRKIPPEIETEVLTSCNYRCCVCFQLNEDLEEKEGQIAHIDGNPSNNDRNNLVFLCHDHHSRYDSTSRQSKGLTEGVVRAATQRLQEHFRLIRKKSVQIVLTLNRDYEAFSNQDCSQLIADLHRITATAGGIRTLSVTPGSVKVHLEVSGELLTRLLRAQERGLLKELNITRIEYSPGKHGSIEFDPTFDCQLGLPSKRDVLQVVRDPDYVQSFIDGSRSPDEIMVKDAWPREGFATLVLFTSNTTVGRALLIPKSSFPAWPVDRPRELLSAFAERFCKPIALFGGKKIVFDKTLFARTPSELGRAMGFEPPLASFTYWIEPIIGAGRFYIAVFCMFGEEYVKELFSHGIGIDLDKWKNRRNRAS
jgi:hypothetical protein